MRQLYDYHVHTNLTDGEGTPEEVVLSAIEKGLYTLGFSEHSYTFFDTRYCLPADYSAYREEISRLRMKYRDSIRILCGIEQDYFGHTPTCGFDYVIGSVHYVYKDGAYHPLDDDRETLKAIIDDHFGGDALSLAESYFASVGDVVKKTSCDIIGHLDLITKFDEPDPLFDASHPRYVKAWQTAVDALLPYGKPFEINYGAITRGWRKTPYPAPDIVAYIKDRGGRFIYSSDSHSPENVASFLNYNYRGISS